MGTMEFSDLIKISRVDGVKVHQSFEHPTIMSLGITGHHLILATDIMKSAQIMVGIWDFSWLKLVVSASVHNLLSIV